MRRALLFGLPVLAILGAGLGGYVFLHHGNLLADAHFRMAHGDAHGAEIDLDTYLRGHPGNAQASFDLGEIKLAENNLVAAERLFRIALKGGYNPAAIVAPLGETYLQQHRFEDVLNDFPADHAPPGGLADTLSLRASAYLALHQPQQARQAADQAVAAAPDKNGPEIVAARIDIASNDAAGAEARVDHLLARDPKLPDAILLKIDLLMRRDDLPGALKFAQSLLAANPASPAAKMAAARTLAAMGRDVEALKLANDVHPPHPARHRRQLPQAAAERPAARFRRRGRRTHGPAAGDRRTAPGGIFRRHCQARRQPAGPGAGGSGQIRRRDPGRCRRRQTARLRRTLA